MTKKSRLLFFCLLTYRDKFTPPVAHSRSVERSKCSTLVFMPILLLQAIETKSASYRGKTRGPEQAQCSGPLMLVYWKKSGCISRHMHNQFFTIIELLIPTIILITIHINFEIKCDVKLVVCNKIACIYTDRFLMVRGYVKP